MKTPDDNNDSAEHSVARTTGAPVEEESALEPGNSAESAKDEPVGEADKESFNVSPEKNDPPATRPSRGLFSSFAGWLALLLALLAVAGVAYLAWRSQDSGRDAAGNEAAIASLSDNLAEAVSSLRNLETALAGLGETDRQRSEDIASLERELSESLQQTEILATRLGNLEDAISSLQGVSAGVRDTWILAEAEYYMQIANAQLQLAGNPQIAALALNFADERIRQLANPALGTVRRALTEELQALESMEKADLEGATLALASLADRVESLPLNENVDPARDDVASPDPELRGFARAVASMKEAFSGIVSVRRTDEALAPLLSPDAAWFLRANLALKLQAARLALLKGEQGVFVQCLDDAAAWLGEYYDTDNRAIASALETIAGLKDSGVSVSLPDISESLRLLRQYQTLRDAESNTDNSGGNQDSPDEPGQ
ncbi:MAG: uroporphyrinogen-III C-methyltransferase [Woeseia sp.]